MTRLKEILSLHSRLYTLCRCQARFYPFYGPKALSTAIRSFMSVRSLGKRFRSQQSLFFIYSFGLILSSSGPR